MKKIFISIIFFPVLHFGQNPYPTNGLQVFMPIVNGTVQNMVNNGLNPVATNIQPDSSRNGIANQSIRIPDQQAKFTISYAGQESLIESQALSVAMWVKADSIKQTYFNLFEIRTSFFLRFRIDKIIQYGYFYRMNPASYATRDLSFPTPSFYDSVFVGKWNHLALTTRLDTNHPSGSVTRFFKLYLNGQAFDSANTQIGFSDINIIYQLDTTALAFGCRTTSNSLNFLNGSLDDIFYYNRSLTDQEVLNLYNYSFSNVGIAEKPLIAAQMYPNPVSTDLYVSYNGVVKSYRIFDMTGRFISEDAVHADQFQIRAQSLKTGSYIIELTDAENLVIRQKFLKK
ncbi:MAG: LamG-like jellyroll fold domain-containing protein [Thermaurantimonas sp.]